MNILAVPRTLDPATLPATLASTLTHMTALNYTHFMPTSLATMVWFENGAPRLEAAVHPATGPGQREWIDLRWVPRVASLLAAPSQHELEGERSQSSHDARV